MLRAWERAEHLRGNYKTEVRLAPFIERSDEPLREVEVRVTSRPVLTSSVLEDAIEKVKAHYEEEQSRFEVGLLDALRGFRDMWIDDDSWDDGDNSKPLARPLVQARAWKRKEIILTRALEIVREMEVE